MSLYEDLDVTPGPGASSAAAGWSLPMQKSMLLQQQRRSQQLQQQAASGGGGGGSGGGHHQRSGSGGSAGAASTSGPTLAPVLNLKGKRDNRGGPGGVIVGNLGAGAGGGEYRFNQRTGRMERATAPAGAKSGTNDPTLALGLDDDYNPAYPNEYEEVVGMVRAKRKMQELAADSEKQQQKQKSQQQHKQHGSQQNNKQQHHSQKSAAKAAPAAAAEASGHDSDGSFHRSGSDNSDNSDHEEEEKKRRMGRGAYIAPPTSLLEQDSKQLAEPPASSGSSSAAAPYGLPYGGASNKPTLAEKHNVSTAAANMMAKMGYRHGQGLGREGQGMASALSVEKTSKRGGKIVSELDKYKNPSLVIMLTNMVGPGEVDDDLEGEIRDECKKYGPVVLVTIFELPRPNVPPEEAVRIFVEFERFDSAIKAMNELNGRFFGGRTVTCRFYDAEKFRDLELESHPLQLELND